jgi:pyruvate formate lyase activating enzyme
MCATTLKKGMVFDVEKYAIHDGPGIRTSVFFKGCPLRCRWCHNPEGQSSKLELIHRKSRCIDCGECVKNCSREALSLVGQHISVDRGKCVLCGKCSQVCPSDALSIVGKEMDAEEVMKEIEKDMIFYDESEGGVTFSGGEPLLQPDFLNSLLDKCKERGIHTTVDTCGFASYDIIDRIRGKVDLFLYDIKIMDDAKHRKYTRVSNKLILGNLKKLAQNGSSLVISFPIIPGINDDGENVTRTARFIRSLPSIEQVNLLPYHRAAIEKYKNLGKPYRLGKLLPPSNQKIESIREEMEAFGLRVRIGGG